MLCSRPFTRGHAEFGCGQCVPCRINRMRMWTSRLMLESFQHECSFFVTLTYRPERLPLSGSVELRDVQLFMKRLREAIKPSKIRYFIAAEYGDERHRAHYHAIIFGALSGFHKNPESGKPYDGCSCVICKSWGAGNVFIGSCTPHSIAYCVSYCVKSMRGSKNREYWEAREPWRKGLKPEFAVMSKNPGIGVGAVPEFVKAMRNEKTGELFLEDGDIRSVWRYERKLLPFGRLLRQKMRLAVFGSEKAPDSANAMRELVSESERLAVGHREFMRVKGLKRVKSQHRAEALVRLSRERKGNEAV